MCNKVLTKDLTALLPIKYLRHLQQLKSKRQEIVPAFITCIFS